MQHERTEVLRIKTYEELTFADDFMFCKILQSNPELCKELAELIIGRNLGEIVQISRQHVIEITSDGRGVRFDVYMQDDRDTDCDIEMQTRIFPELPKRTRYYQGILDIEYLERSESYEKLPRSYVIFISLLNPFPKAGRHKYTFANLCREQTDLELGDAAEKIFLSAEGTKSDISEGLEAFLTYLSTQKSRSKLTDKLATAVEDAKLRKKWGVEYMTLYEMRKMDRAAWLAEGRAEGKAEGKAEGRTEGVVQFCYERLHYSPEKIAEELGISRDEVMQFIGDGRQES